MVIKVGPKAIGANNQGFTRRLFSLKPLELMLKWSTKTGHGFRVFPKQSF
ncbi:hypothetical protein ROSI111154_24520 [Rouxiella silvae]